MLLLLLLLFFTISFKHVYFCSEVGICNIRFNGNVFLSRASPKWMSGELQLKENVMHFGQGITVHVL